MIWYDLLMMELKKNQEYTVEIEGYSSDGLGVCRLDGRAVFVPRTIKGEQWRIRLVKLSAGASYAIGIELLRPSPFRTEPACPYFGRCGGCDLWHMNYEEELRFKLERVNDALRRIGKQSLQAAVIHGSDEITRYRNKAIFAVQEEKGEARFGFYRGRTHELVPVEACLIQNELNERAAAAVVRYMREHHLPAYRETDGAGLIRHVFCRRARRTADAVVCIVSAGGLGKHTQPLVSALREACPELSGIVLNVNRSRGNTVLAGDFYTLWGRAEITDEICSSRFEIAPQAFFQVNPPQAEKLYTIACDYAAADEKSLVLELYCGAGTISLALARQAGRVIGAEIVEEAVANARKNALVNGVTNVEFLCGDAGEIASSFSARALAPEVIVVDPPRKGMSEEAVRAVASMSPERIVYVSCDPATLSRDILRFSALGYGLQKVEAVDMFPRTHHVECVVLMSKM